MRSLPLPRIMAGIAGFAAAAAALFLLVSDALDTGVWTKEQRLANLFAIHGVTTSHIP